MANTEDKTACLENDPAQQKVADALSDDEVTVSDFMTFAKEYDVNVSLSDLPKHLDEDSNLGLVE